jgi:hypothetical protein
MGNLGMEGKGRMTQFKLTVFDSTICNELPKKQLRKRYYDTNNPVYDPAEEEFRRRMQKKKSMG